MLLLHATAATTASANTIINSTNITTTDNYNYKYYHDNRGSTMILLSLMVIV